MSSKQRFILYVAISIVWTIVSFVASLLLMTSVLGNDRWVATPIILMTLAVAGIPLQKLGKFMDV